MAKRGGKKSIGLSEALLAETFGLNRTYDYTPLLTEWLGADGKLNEMDMYLLQRVMPDLIENVDYWNEEELKVQFIGMIILLANFKKPIKIYLDREVSAEIGESI